MRKLKTNLLSIFLSSVFFFLFIFILKAYAIEGRCVPTPPCYCNEECFKCGPGGCSSGSSVSSAGQCTYACGDYCLDSSSARYSGDIVSFTVYNEDAREDFDYAWDCEINCARKMFRDRGLYEDWSSWESIDPGSCEDTMRKKLCR